MRRALAAAGLAVLLGGCRDAPQGAPDAVAAGDAARGRVLLEARGCGACHTIPGVRRAEGLVGPSLAGLATRSYIGGSVENTPERLVLWIQNPRRLAPRTAMPALGIPEDEARDMAAYLLQPGR
jgi:cytochrome c2